MEEDNYHKRRMLPAPRIDGRDELNLAEFPLCALSDRVKPDQKTIVFEDRIWDSHRGETLVRQLTISASDHYGLPTALDDDVILGLIQLSRLQSFSDRRVSFTRYQLLRLLGWRDSTRNYQRLAMSLNRWIGVTLYYQNAWWSKEEQCWVDEKFHILENVSLFDRKKLRSRGKAIPPVSSFTWNEVVFRSFQAGNLKSLDFDFFKTLNGAVAKRLYRFLDKRFWRRKHWVFNLKEFAWAHIGLSRNYDVAGLKRKLQPGIEELEQLDFLAPIPLSQRFTKISSGEWLVVFDKYEAKVQKPPCSERNDGIKRQLVEALIKRGVTPATAERTVLDYSSKSIKTHLEIFDWLMETGDKKISINPSGFLVASIKSDYAPPKGFISREEAEKHARNVKERQQLIERREKEAAAKEEAALKAHEEIVQRFWERLPKRQRKALETAAIAAAPPFDQNLISRGGKLGAVARERILQAYALSHAPT